MGTVLDTTVFIDLQRAVRPFRPASAVAEVSGRLDFDRIAGLDILTISFTD